MILHPIDKLDTDADRALTRKDFTGALDLLEELIRMEQNGQNNPWFLLSACLRKATALQNLERDQEAYIFLTEETPRITGENHATQKEYWDLLADIGDRTGHGAEARDARGTSQEIALDWIASLERAEELSAAGRDEESLVFFERSLRMNPGEAGTRTALENAAFGKVRAFLALNKKDDARHVLEKPWVDKDRPEYLKLLAACGS